MKPVAIAEIKKELKTLTPSQLQELCLTLARYKKENKELLTYLLFESVNEENYITSVKELVREGFLVMNVSSVYLAKKTLRKNLRIINKFSKYSGKPETEINLLLFFLSELKSSKLDFNSSAVIMNMVLQQKKKIKKALEGLHEDLQFDYEKELSRY